MNQLNCRIATQVLQTLCLSVSLIGNTFADEDSQKTGIWRSVTNDVYIVIAGDQVSYYETTKGNREVGSQSTCLQIQGSHELAELEFAVPDKVADFTSVSPAELTYDSPGNLYPVSIFRVESLPPSCLSLLMIRAQYQHNPELDFDIFWNQLNENYAFFAYRGISQEDWNMAYRDYRAKAVATKDGKALFAVLSDLLQTTFGEREVNSKRLAADEHIELSAALDNWDFSIETAGDYNQGRAVLTNPLTSYLKNRVDFSAFEPLANQGAIWGVYSVFAKLKNRQTGYLLLNSMVDFNTDANAATRIEDFDVQKAAVTKWMNRVIALANEKGLDTMIIDVRNNLGGFDKIALQIAGYFADKPRLALVKQVRVGGTIDDLDLSEAFKQQVYPNETTFDGKIILLISRHTVSAGETFALAMSQFPRVRLVGESTAGSLSDVLQRHTRNGWILSLSNEVFHEPGAETYTFDSALEGKGVQPDQYVPYDAAAQFSPENPQDAILDMILAIDN